MLFIETNSIGIAGLAKSAAHHFHQRLTMTGYDPAALASLHVPIVPYQDILHINQIEQFCFKRELVLNFYILWKDGEQLKIC